MSIQYTDSLGPVFDTGTTTQEAQRANVQVETHLAAEIDTGSKLVVTAVAASHSPQRAATSPR